MGTQRRPRWVAFASALLLLVAGGGQAQAGVLYGADGERGNLATNLYILDPATGGVLSTVGSIGFPVSGLAFHPQTGVLYASTAARPQGSPMIGELLTIDLATGQGTIVGSFGLPAAVTLGDLTFSPSGTLYGWSSRGGATGLSGDLFTVNLATGAATQVSDAGLTSAGAGLAFSPSGALFLTGGDRPPGTQRLLFTVDPVTGQPTGETTLTGLPLAAGILPALAVDEDGTLFGVVHQGMQVGGTAFLVTINPATGAITTRGPTVGGLDAITFGPAPVPEPGGLVLGGLGALALLGYVWRRRPRPAGAAA